MKNIDLQKIRKVLIALTIMPLLFLLVCKFQYDDVIRYDDNLVTRNFYPKDLASKKLFIYLLQTEQCIPEKLKRNESFGNPDECMCDVIVFSYKEKCLDSAPSHMEYIYSKTATSLNEGRNTLYKVARSRNINYLYYILLDDDVKLSYNEKYAPPEMKLIPPLRSFEHFLFSHEPAVGVLNYRDHHTSDDTIQSYQRICSPHIKSSEPLPPNRTVIGDRMPLYLTVVHFDAMFNAIHRDAVPTLLPYSTSYDWIDWTISQRVLIVQVEFMFRGHAVMFTPVNLPNKVHRSYPRIGKEAAEAWKKVITEVVQDIPKNFTNEKMIKEFFDNPLSYCEDISHTYCFTHPPRHPIRKYSHLLQNWSLN